MMASGICSSCKAPVEWMENAKSKKPMIFDATPQDGGTGYEFTPEGAVYVKDAPKGTRVYVSHFGTCPNAASHRKGK